MSTLLMKSHLNFLNKKIKEYPKIIINTSFLCNFYFKPLIESNFKVYTDKIYCKSILLRIYTNIMMVFLNRSN